MGIPDLARRCRLPLILADMTDLGVATPAVDAPAFVDGDPIDLGSALGWLYVAEGSNMGAALLRKEAQKLGLTDDRGARHLAPAPAGPAPNLRAFVAALDAFTLSDDEESHAQEGALAALHGSRLMWTRILADASAGDLVRRGRTACDEESGFLAGYSVLHSCHADILSYLKEVPQPQHDGGNTPSLSRYCDQPMNWQSRLFGVGGTAIIGAMVMNCAFLTWRIVKPTLVSSSAPLVMDLRPAGARTRGRSRP